MKICLAATEVTCFSGSDQMTYTLPHSQTNLDPNPLLPFCYLFFCCGLGQGRIKQFILSSIPGTQSWFSDVLFAAIITSPKVTHTHMGDGDYGNRMT